MKTMSENITALNKLVEDYEAGNVEDDEIGGKTTNIKISLEAKLQIISLANKQGVSRNVLVEGIISDLYYGRDINWKRIKERMPDKRKGKTSVEYDKKED